jgi:hypothetical protein
MTLYPPNQHPAMIPPGNRRPSGAALGLGIASLVLGVLAVVTICIPVVPLAIAGLGMVLALVGMVFSARRGGVAMPIIGAVVCAVPIVLVVGTYAGICTLSFFGRPGTPTGPGPTTTTTTSMSSSTGPAASEPSSTGGGAGSDPPGGSDARREK